MSLQSYNVLSDSMVVDGILCEFFESFMTINVAYDHFEHLQESYVVSLWMIFSGGKPKSSVSIKRVDQSCSSVEC